MANTVSTPVVPASTPLDLSENRTFFLVTLGVLVVAIVALVWGYWNTLAETAKYWQGDQYSHGVLVPPFAVALVWLRRRGRDHDPADAVWPEGVFEKCGLGVALGLLAAGLASMSLAGWLFAAAGPTATTVPPSPASSWKWMLETGIPGWTYVAGLLVWGAVAAMSWAKGQPTVQVAPLERFLGLGLLAAGLTARLLCADIGLDVPEMWTFVPSLAGLILLVGGWRMGRWTAPAVVFLLFMFPLPFTVESKLLVPLQALATRCSTFAIQTFGIEAVSEGGNFIRIGELKLGVVEQCSGLRMATVFVALSVAIVLVARLPWWQNLVVLISAVPIALFANVTRITVTGILHLTAGKEWADRVFHDWAGYLMPIMALMLLWGELAVMARLFYEMEDEASLIPSARFER